MHNLLQKLNEYENILFDLDNTLYDQINYDKAIFYKYFLQNHYSSDAANQLGKELAFEKAIQPEGYMNTFDDFIHKKNLDIKVEKLLSFYHNPPRVDLEIPKSSLEILISAKNKNLVLITNGYNRVQYNKIISLNIGKYFNHIFVLSPGTKPNLKPSAEVKDLLNLSKGKTVYIGDNLETDKNFALHCGFDFIHLDIKTHVFSKE